MTVATATASSIGPHTSSMCMMPALLTKTFSFGYLVIKSLATAAMSAGSAMSSSTDSMP